MLTRMLIVDENLPDRNLMGEMLIEEGYEVSHASSGEEALQNYKKGSYGAVFSDIRLKGYGGLDLIKKIRAIDPQVQIIVVSSIISVETVAAAFKSGASDYLVKPFEDLEVVVSAAKSAMERASEEQEQELLVHNLRQKNSELERANERLQEIAVRDGLTGLFNHRYFQEILPKEVSRAERHGRSLSLLFLDLDDFKVYNDTYGHQLGDTLLKQLSHIIMAGMREGDTVARYGGEVFVAVLPETDRDYALQVAEKLRASVENHPFRGEETQPGGMVTISLGVSSWTRGGGSAVELIQRADQALYKAKEEGKNCVRTIEQ